MLVVLVVGILALVGVLLWLRSGILVPNSLLRVTRAGVHFPTVSGANLLREQVEFPRDFPGEFNLLLIPFQQRQQGEVNTWLPAAQELERSIMGFYYFELPTIYELPALSRTFINEGMRAGIPDRTARERTITLYLDKPTFKDALGILSEETITVLLVDKDGSILWRENGVFDQQKWQSLQAQLPEPQ